MIERIKADILCVIYWIKDSDYDAASQEEKREIYREGSNKKTYRGLGCLKRMLALG